MTVIDLDALDRKIIERLGRDARISNRQIASDLGVTEGTIRARIKRLQHDNVIQFTVVTDFRMVGSPSLVMLGIHADPAHVPRLAAKLSELSAINCVIVLLGRFNLLAMGLFTSLTDVDELSRRSILTLKGVRSIETIVSLRQFKYDHRMARIVVTPKARQRRDKESKDR